MPLVEWSSLQAAVKEWRNISRRTSRGEHIFADVRVDGPGWCEFWELYADGNWEPWTTDLMDAHLKPGCVFVDVGAWIGPLTIYAALACDARVVALEPDSVAYEALCDMINRNELRGVEAASIAVATAPGRYRLLRAPEGDWGDSMAQLGQSDNGRSVPGDTLAQILADLDVRASEIGLVKIDVEGYEEQLMPELGPWLGLRGIPFQVACHDVEPKDDWFVGYSDVRKAAGEDTARGFTGEVVALPWRSGVSRVVQSVKRKRRGRS